MRVCLRYHCFVVLWWLSLLSCVMIPWSNTRTEIVRDIYFRNTLYNRLCDFFSNFSKESGDLKDRFDEVKELYDQKLQKQKDFRERTEKALDAAEKVKSSLTSKLRVIESKSNYVYTKHRQSNEWTGNAG